MQRPSGFELAGPGFGAKVMKDQIDLGESGTVIGTSRTGLQCRRDGEVAARGGCHDFGYAQPWPGHDPSHAQHIN